MSRLALVEAFGRIGTPALPYLLHALSTCPNPVVRRSCGKALAKIRHPSATDALIHTLVNDDDTVTRASAAGALARMDGTAVDKLMRLIADTEVGMTAKGHAAWAVAFMRGDAAERLYAYVHDDSVDVRLAVIAALGGMAQGDSLPDMAGGGDDDWGDVEIGHMKRRAVAAIKGMLADREIDVRAEAVMALANAGCAEYAHLIAAFLDDEAELRRCACLALMKVGDVTFVDRLRRLAEDDEVEEVRRVAALACRSLESAAEAEEDAWD